MESSLAGKNLQPPCEQNKISLSVVPRCVYFNLIYTLNVKFLLIRYDFIKFSLTREVLTLYIPKQTLNCWTLN